MWASRPSRSLQISSNRAADEYQHCCRADKRPYRSQLGQGDGSVRPIRNEKSASRPQKAGSAETLQYDPSSGRDPEVHLALCIHLAEGDGGWDLLIEKEGAVRRACCLIARLNVKPTVISHSSPAGDVQALKRWNEATRPSSQCQSDLILFPHRNARRERIP